MPLHHTEIEDSPSPEGTAEGTCRKQWLDASASGTLEIAPKKPVIILSSHKAGRKVFGVIVDVDSETQQCVVQGFNGNEPINKTVSFDHLMTWNPGLKTSAIQEDIAESTREIIP